LNNNEQHINEILKQKFENFAPKPPDRVWTGIAAALDKEVAPVWYNSLVAKIAAALLFIALLFGGYWMLNRQPLAKSALPVGMTDNINTKPKEGGNNSLKNNQSVVSDTISYNNNKADEDAVKSQAVSSATQGNSSQKVVKSGVASKVKENNGTAKQSKDSFNNNSSSGATFSKAYMGSTGIEELESRSVDLKSADLPEAVATQQDEDDIKDIAPSVQKTSRHWAVGFYFTPEKLFDPFDSVTLQNIYALSIEPVYYFNKHWFIRPALGFQYSRDKGFVKADYLSWDYMGSYEDVVEVTFDSTGGTVVPVYHTQNREVYDSIRHETISEETNRYLYLQTSVVFGYHNHAGKFGWSVYAGPGVNFVLFSKQDNPVGENASVISLDYDLPKRRSPQYHIRAGLGLDYTIGKNWLVSVEPEYRFYVNGINAGGVYNHALSGLAMRFGFIYTIR